MSLNPLQSRSRTWRQIGLGAAAVSLLLTLFVASEMFQSWRRMGEALPRDHPRLVALREALAREPGSDALKEQIRSEERALRETWFRADRKLRQGAWILLVAVSVFAVAVRIGTRRRIPMPGLRGPGHDPDHRLSSLGRLAVGVVAGCLVATALALPMLEGKGGAAEVARGTWPRFRGHGGAGISPYPQAPLALDARAGQERNLRWKSIVPLPGLSSPVVWDERLFLTGATESGREVYGYDALSGKLLWRRPVSAGPESSRIPQNIYHETGYAAPTAVTDGEHLWALFANGDLICLSVLGQQRWCINLGLPNNMYGLAASPILVEGKLIVQLDQEPDHDGTKSALLALDPATGKRLWRTARDVASSWPTPIPVAAPSGPQIVTCANPWVIAYDPTDGREIWRVIGVDGDGGPSPAFGEGLVFAVNVASPLMAIRPDGAGDVTETHVAWTWDDGLPDVCSPVAARGMVWLQSTDGLTTCLDALSGEKLWERDWGVSFYASPALAAERVYLISRKGRIMVVAAERALRELATGDLGEPCDTSPAFAEGRIYIRGRDHLFCFEESGT
jgi:outer membrane protein assembly factor BamB